MKDCINARAAAPKEAGCVMESIFKTSESDEKYNAKYDSLTSPTDKSMSLESQDKLCGVGLKTTRVSH